MVRNMHSHIRVVLDHPMFTDETRKIMMLLISGIRNEHWLKDTQVFGTPEKGCKVVSSMRDIDSDKGYYELYVHDYYVDIFIRPARSSGMFTISESKQFTEDTWDEGFSWSHINSTLGGVMGIHSWA